MKKVKFAYSGLELEAMALAFNYRKYWFRQIPKLSQNSRVLEVGAGIGNNIPLLLTKFNQVFLIEPDVHQQNLLRSNFKKDMLARKICIYNSYSEIDNSATFDLILYIDVLEHIEDDQEEVKTAYTRLARDGILFVLVPAFPSLFSNYDKALSHYRRYTKESLTNLFSNDLRIESIFFIDSLGLLGVLINKIFRKSTVNFFAVKVWDSIFLPISQVLDRFLFRNSIGKSILIKARKV